MPERVGYAYIGPRYVYVDGRPVYYRGYWQGDNGYREYGYGGYRGAPPAAWRGHRRPRRRLAVAAGTHDLAWHADDVCAGSGGRLARRRRDPGSGARLRQLAHDLTVLPPAAAGPLAGGWPGGARRRNSCRPRMGLAWPAAGGSTATAPPPAPGSGNEGWHGGGPAAPAAPAAAPGPRWSGAGRLACGPGPGAPPATTPPPGVSQPGMAPGGWRGPTTGGNPPPGHGGTPPGQGGLPPGQSAGEWRPAVCRRAARLPATHGVWVYGPAASNPPMGGGGRAPAMGGGNAYRPPGPGRRPGYGDGNRWAPLARAPAWPRPAAAVPHRRRCVRPRPPRAATDPRE